MKKGNKKANWLFGLYCFLCITPFLVPALNRIEPWFLGMPFNVWSVLLLAFLCCCLIKYLSVHVWDSYDAHDEEGGHN